jgi:hypothetical protein
MDLAEIIFLPKIMTASQIQQSDIAAADIVVLCLSVFKMAFAELKKRIDSSI